MKNRFVPRKRPVQRRSQATVDAILDAAAQVLRKKGYAKTTTNTIAERAGVSIGSLYEYFPNKDAVFAALQEKLHRAQFASVISQISIAATASAKDVIEKVLSARISSALEQPDIVTILEEQVPAQVFQAQRAKDFEDFSQIMAAFAETHADQIRIKHIDTAISLGIQMVDLTIRHLASHQPDLLRDPNVLHELTDMMCRYILNDD